VNIYISADMEGVAGITHVAQTRPSFPDYQRFRRLLTAEVSAAVAGAVEAGATRVVVNDGHLAMTNIVIEELHPAAELISGTNKLLGQMEGIDESFDGVFFVGHHQGDGVGDGVISHTLMSAALRRVRVNGVLVDEASLNARVAGAFGVPAVLMTGDDAVCADAEQAMPGIVVAPVKAAISRLCARSLGVEAARALIAERAAEAVRKLREDAPQPIRVDGPVRFDLEFRQTAAAHFCTLFPGVERTSPTEIAFEHDSMITAFRHFWGLATLALSVQDGVFGTGL
jgi:D-amino peptidase